jgi:hypothetical protein
VRLALLFCGATTIGCSSAEETAPGTLVVTFGKETDEWPSVAHLRLRAGATASTATDTLYDGPVEGASVDIGQIGTDASVAFVAEATDTSGAVIARGQTPTFSGAELQGDVAPLLLSPVAGASRTSDGLTLPWKRGDGVALLGKRYAVFGSATQTDAEAYDVGLLIPSVGGAGWSRPPRMLLAASTRDIFVLDEAGADLADIFSVTTPTTATISAEEAADLVRGQIVRPAATDAAASTTTAATVGQWIGGPCGEGDATGTASDRVLYLAPDDQLVLTRLPAPRRGAACAILNDGSLVVAGGTSGTLTIVSTGGSVVDATLADERRNGGAIVTSDGSLLLFGGSSAGDALVAPPPVRITLPCAGSCAPAQVVLAGGSAVPAGSARVLPSASGRAFVLTDRASAADGTGTAGAALQFVDASLGGVSVTTLPTRVVRSVPVALGLAGERLLLAGGTTGAGTGSTDVEIVNSP